MWGVFFYSVVFRFLFDKLFATDRFIVSISRRIDYQTTIYLKWITRMKMTLIWWLLGMKCSRVRRVWLGFPRPIRIVSWHSFYINQVPSNCFSEWQATQELQEIGTSDSGGSSHSGNFLTANFTSHSGRRGAAQDADTHMDVTTTTWNIKFSFFFWIRHRGGSTLDSINRIFCYITGNTKSDTACARALSNWPNANEGGFLPTLSCIDPSTAE